jgi:hypothetical protein
MWGNEWDGRVMMNDNDIYCMPHMAASSVLKTTTSVRNYFIYQDQVKIQYLNTWVSYQN